MSEIDMVLESFIAQTLHDYDPKDLCHPREVIELSDTDITLLPIDPSELSQDYIKVIG